MSGINQYLKERLSEMGNATYIAPDIPEKKLNNAVNAFKFNGDPASIIGICDNTTFKSAKEGFLLTGLKIVFKEVFENPIEIYYENIDSVDYILDVQLDSKGKEKRDESLRFNLKSGDVVNVKYGSEVARDKLAEIINDVISKYDGYEEQNQLEPIENLSELLKVAYIKIIVNMAFDNDGEVDDREFAEILQLMTRLNLNLESRNEIRLYIGSIDNIELVKDLVSVIRSQSPDGMEKSIQISLVKDLISINSSLTKTDAINFSFLQKNRELFEISDEEIELAQMAIANDRKILDRSYTDTAITKSLKELSAKAGAVGVPLGAVYLSGSVMGLSAAGMTSGLATLGMGGVLGFSSMATGIGAAIILGVVAYKGIKHLTGSGVDEGDKRREIMLQEVIRQSQRTINMVIEDINFLTKELSSALASEHVTKERLEQLAAKLSQFIRASQVVGSKTEQAETERARLKSPEYLDVDRLKALTSDHDKSKYFDFVMGYYKEDILKEVKEGVVVERQSHRLIKSSNSKEMEQLGQVFELLDYASTQSAIKGKLKGFFS
ncbi:hypothetical protein [Nitrincola iocasae]|uniref:ENT domain-containing protein n=1 Tax=Nitrincola iocasae TaxID=2614693 RepID=A0A5J6LC89_9GAMM|nr:hypothetical protein [Nitrincola iocasae]QEW05908.1 hypothetical protein F5I99_05060 [Nitrincola iocasae]